MIKKEDLPAIIKHSLETPSSKASTPQPQSPSKPIATDVRTSLTIDFAKNKDRRVSRLTDDAPESPRKSSFLGSIFARD